MLSAYPVVSYGKDILTDISRRFVIHNIDTDHSRNIYFEYMIKNWKAPEHIAYDYYGSCDYVWLVLVINNIIDPVNDWLLQDEELKQLVVQKYGRENTYGVHHYERDGIIYDHFVSGATMITNYEYENNINEQKRKIKIIYPEFVSEIEALVKKEFTV